MWVVGSVKKSKASSDGPRAFFKGFSLHMVYIVYISITDDLILSEHDDATWMNMGRLLPPPATCAVQPATQEKALLSGGGLGWCMR